ncbi:hypothetical protein [Caulobacter soli]|uniref:hypothetical protein n=1 Tax=Caulobacter soli TaxID=2708539 RepID=UPI0013EADDA5|nr:hypothetical protein [Caulobacter soli]
MNLTLAMAGVLSVMASTRDEFSSSIVRALALRAAFRCSLCDGPTVGPSDDGVMGVATTGVAAHICAAAPGGPRYDPLMTPSARGAFDNGIWLCANHASLVDRDVTTYTVEVLARLKRDHERRCRRAQQSGGARPAPMLELLAFGPTVIGYGELVRAQGSIWTFRVEHFVLGDLAALVLQSEAFDAATPYERYVVVNSLGDGRSLAAPLIIEKASGAVLVTAHVEARFPRLAARALPRDVALSAAHDLSVQGGAVAMVSGLMALPQRILSCLSMRRGESPFHQDFGSRFSEYLTLFSGTPWLDDLLKLEVVRLASIPYADPVLGQAYTPLQAVEQVTAVTILGSAANGRLPVRLELQVAGEGPWSRDLAIFV